MSLIIRFNDKPQRGEVIMGRDKARDDKFFNCSQEHEDNYVSGLYGKDKPKVKEFLEKKCNEGKINYSKHQAVYELIKKELGLQIPD